MILCLGLVSTALATPRFDPTTPAARFEGRETWTQPEDIKLWSAIERWEDREPELFRQESFNDGLAWRDADFSPWIATAFGSSTPHSSTFLLHAGLSAEVAVGTPILMVPGAGDNASRGFVTMATRLDRGNRPVFALTFAHPHGDVFQHAEAVANAIAVIREKTGAEQVDVVAHSKGGIAATVYASHHAGADWGRDDYAAHGTPYRGDIRRLVLIATPLAGVDTMFRWSGLNFFSLDPQEAVSPTSWSTYYPSTSAVPAIREDLSDQDLLPDGLDLFPGQRQVVAALEDLHPLPGRQPWLGLYALQTDWLTTYNGGIGLSSRSEGIEAAVEAGGRLIERLTQVGVDPNVELYLLAGRSPIMPSGDDGLTDLFAGLAPVVDYAELMAEATRRGIPMAADADELDGLDRGLLVLGELTGPSDGLVFTASALHEPALTARGAAVAETRVVNLSHVDLLYASPITGQLLVDLADDGPSEDAWARGVGKRYIEADTLGWVEGVLADDPAPGDTGTGSPTGTRPALPGEAPSDFARPCGGCTTADAPMGALGLLGIWLGWTRRRR